MPAPETKQRYSTATAEGKRLQESLDRTQHWKRWGPYLSERAWGTVREDYSAGGEAWDYLTHEQSRSRAYRWSEDGIGGICDRHQILCFALALWNGNDRILKERLFGLTNEEGNHGEDVKEYYFFLDSTPTHSYMKFLYKYPHRAFPYEQLIEENGKRGKHDPEYELIETGIFDDDRYFDVAIEYAKGSCEDILIRITATNRGAEAASLSLIPTLWFRNRWSWGGETDPKPILKGDKAGNRIAIETSRYSARSLYLETAAPLLFTENETNNALLYGSPNSSPYVKDGFNELVINGNESAVNPNLEGTKSAAHYQVRLEPGASEIIRLRLVPDSQKPEHLFGNEFEKMFSLRIDEADEFYETVIPDVLTNEARLVMRQSLAGLLWSKQYYHYAVERWLEGDPAFPPPPEERWTGRNHEWVHLFNADIISMPDTWEYPWYAAWDLAFHCIPLALVDGGFAKDQLILMLREWYMHPNGQLPAYEWDFSNVSPPVHAWAALRVYQMDEMRSGKQDRAFLERVFHKLLLNFTWWVNRKDAAGMNVFQGGFLGLDNIGIFDRSMTFPSGGRLEQSDGTSWMAMYTLNMLAIALELAIENPAYEDVASKFWEHFVYIADAMNNLGRDEVQLWDEEDGFYYDVVHVPGSGQYPLKIRSMVGLIPLFAVEIMEPDIVERFPGFRNRMEWFLSNRSDLTSNIAITHIPGKGERQLLAVVDPDRLRRVLKIMLDEEEFLSPYGIRALSKYHKDHPFVLHIDGVEHRVDYEPGESTTGMFGGNSNWRGPIWFPMNFLIIEALQRYHFFLGDEYLVECPTGSGQMKTLWDVAEEISHRLTSIFLYNEEGKRPAFGCTEKFQSDPHWKDNLQFHEYFNGDTGCGLGASHQTGWTALIAKLVQQNGVREGV